MTANITTPAVPPMWPKIGRHKADYVPDYEKLIAAFRQVNPKVKVFVCLPPPAFSERWGINDKTIHDEIIPLIRKVARNQTPASLI